MSNRIVMNCLIRVLLPLIVGVFISGCSVFDNEPAKAQQARQMLEQGELQRAISLYDSHLNSRLRNRTRPSSENPYFYCALIGDALFRAGDLQTAFRTYQAGRNAGIEDRMLAMRYRDIAHQLAQIPEGGYQLAIDFLHKHRGLDELMIDLDIDLYHRSMLAAEDDEDLQLSIDTRHRPALLWAHRIGPIRSLCEFKFFYPEQRLP